MDESRQPVHRSVLAQEVMELLAPRPGETAVDCTAGVGGHARLLWNAVQPGGRVIAIDQDPKMLALAREQSPGMNIEWVHANFEDVATVLKEKGLEAVDVILADIGFCSDQLADAERGLSFQSDGPLDMRLDQTRGETAADVIARLSERDLADLIWRYGEERHSRRVAKVIVEERKKGAIETTGQLAALARRCIPRGKGHSIDPATRIFQALRIFVNDELGALERFLEVLPECLRPGGRAAVISFHSLEDRLVKQAFRKNPDLFTQLTRKPVTAGEQEGSDNPRARSAKLRAIRKQ